MDVPFLPCKGKTPHSNPYSAVYALHHSIRHIHASVGVIVSLYEVSLKE